MDDSMEIDEIPEIILPPPVKYMPLIPMPNDRRLFDSIPEYDHLNWNIRTIKKNFMSIGIGSITNFSVYTLVKNNTVFMKPVEKVETSEFESLFGFGCGCNDYDSNRVAVITSPSNYYQNLI